MATAPRTRVSTRPWSEVVREADALDGKPPIPVREPGYEFSNGRKFATPTNPYADNGS